MRIYSILALFCLISVPAAAQTFDQLKDEYLNTSRTFRHFYDAKHLKFNAEGQLKGHGYPGLWTVDGQITISQFELSGKTLHIAGHRDILVYDAASGHLKPGKWAPKISLEIAAPNGSNQLQQLRAALDQVFVTSQAELASVVPDYWKAYVSGTSCDDSVPEPDPKDTTTSAPAPSTPQQGGKIVEGDKITDALPPFSELARQEEISGMVILRGTISRTGTVEQLCIVKPLGADMDDVLIRAVKHWKYRPYLLNGQPIAIRTTIQYDFKPSLLRRRGV